MWPTKKHAARTSTPSRGSEELNTESRIMMPIPIVGWKGQCVRLVPPDRSLHLENALRWMNDPEITATLELNLGFSRKQEEAFFDRIENQNDTDFTWAILDQAGKHIGFIG